MFKTLITLPLAAIAVTSFAPLSVLQAGHGVVDALLVLTPPMFVAGAGLQLLRRSVL
jgi:hypothetical protein